MAAGHPKLERGWSWLRPRVSVIMQVFCASIAPVLGDETGLAEPEERIIQYSATEGLTDPVAQLQKQLAAGTVRLPHEPERGYLPALLKIFRLPVSSQSLVFSKTSSQRDLINPQTPRAVYFGEDVSLAWVPGAAVIDLAAVDPERGPIFYTLDQSPTTPPRFTRRAECLQCHLGPKTLNVPGLVVRSFYTASNGTPLATVERFVNGHNSPLRERWGGWYVTGTHVGEFHLGNTFALNPDQPARIDLVAGANVTDLRARFDTSHYPSPHSDIVALLVLEHQVRMQNLITRANYETRYALDELARVGGAASPLWSGAKSWPEQRIALAGEQLLEYLLFRNEAALRGPVQGTAGFAAEFQRAGPRTADGRSLRQFDLQTRLFRHPCSYLIYSAAFDALPAEMKQYLWRRLEQILTGQDRSATYASLSAPDRQAVLEILRETKPEFAAHLKK